ncbi:sigma-70 family RNA polymerase sigma factor [Pseudomonas sp. NPDC007930]|uniref:RNA polymerase sigma factor n=1 Tax=Pseudomonas sp. NPDC007930 TaxID=3364417 RepID=UPI0036ED8A36
MSQSQFDSFFILQRPSLLRALQRLVRNPSTAEDLLHETYLRVSRALADRSVTHLEPFVFQTARNLALDHLRAARRHERTVVEDVAEQVVLNVADNTSSFEEAAHAERLLKRLSSSLAQLTPRQQKIFTLSRLQGHSYLEIAASLGVSPSTVQKELKLIMAICMGVAQRMG